MGLQRGLFVLRFVRSLVAGASVSGCESPASEVTYRESESQRPYRVTTRKHHDVKQSSSVLFALHAYSTEPDVLPSSYSLVQHAVEQRGMILVVPEGQKDDDGRPYWNATRGCCGNASAPADDLAYLRAVLAEVKRKYAVDGTRVYALGVSNGGFMAHRWACTPGGDLGGIVSIAGVGPDTVDAACTPSTPVRVLQIHGDEDEVIRFEGGTGIRGPYPSARATVERWSALNGCDPKPTDTRSWSFLHGHTTRTLFSGSRADVVLWRFEGDGHQLRSLRFATSELLDFLGAP
jgi:polyhydroxybutyrate depolymerase